MGYRELQQSCMDIERMLFTERGVSFDKHYMVPGTDPITGLSLGYHEDYHHKNKNHTQHIVNQSAEHVVTPSELLNNLSLPILAKRPLLEAAWAVHDAQVL